MIQRPWVQTPVEHGYNTWGTESFCLYRTRQKTFPSWYIYTVMLVCVLLLQAWLFSCCCCCYCYCCCFGLFFVLFCFFFSLSVNTYPRTKLQFLLQLIQSVESHPYPLPPLPLWPTICNVMASSVKPVSCLSLLSLLFILKWLFNVESLLSTSTAWVHLKRHCSLRV